MNFSPRAWLALAIAIILASGVGYSLFLRHQVSVAHEKIKTLSEVLAASEAQVAILNKLSTAATAANKVKQAKVAQIEQKEATGRAKTEAALSEHPDWANAPVPQSVLDSLRDDPEGGD